MGTQHAAAPHGRAGRGSTVSDSDRPRLSLHQRNEARVCVNPVSDLPVEHEQERAQQSETSAEASTSPEPRIKST